MTDRLLPLTRRVALAGALAAGVGAALAACAPDPTVATTRGPAPATHSAQPLAAASVDGFDRTAHSLDDPRSIWLIVDKHRPIDPKDWVPTDLVAPQVPHTNAPLLRKAAAHALERMFAAAKQDGVGLVSLSAYRPYTEQRSIYDRNLVSLGTAATEKLTLRPGYSEHQTGLAIDIGDSSGRCGIQVCFAGTPSSPWLDAHAWRYGFVLRYEQHWTHITGIQWEPWHFRYVGTALAAAYRASHLHTLEQFFDLPAAPTYA